MELPLSSRCDAVMTVVDLVSKQAHFISTHTTVIAEGAARLFLHQQSHPLRYTTASVPARHQTYSSHGLRTPTEPLWSRNSQRVYRKDENSNQRSKVCDLQSTRRHKEVLWLMQNSSSSVQPRQQSLPQCIEYPDHAPFTETLALMARPLCSEMKD